MQKKSVATVLILTIITCGIYGIYWVYKTAQDLESEVGAGKFQPGVLAILCLFLGFIGFILFGMTIDESLNKAREARGIAKVDNQLIYILLGFLIPIVLVALVQSEINKLTDIDPSDAV